MNVALGGTFDPVHDGHRALFERAFELRSVTIGLTSDDLAPKTRSEDRPIRRQRDLGTLDLEVVEFVHAEDGEIITSTRILRGEIDEHGNLTPERDGEMSAGTE